MKKKMNTTYMVELAVLIAIILIMAFTPIGYIRTLGLEITLIVVPVAVGAVTLGPMAGLILGTIFGITQFYPVLRHERFRRHAALHQSGVYLYRLRSHENADGMADRTDFPGTSEGIRYEKNCVSCFLSGKSPVEHPVFSWVRSASCFYQTDYIQSPGDLLRGIKRTGLRHRLCRL